jgi:transposase
MKRRTKLQCIVQRGGRETGQEHGRSAGKAAKELGISESALRRWIEASDIEQGTRPG